MPLIHKSGDRLLFKCPGCKEAHGVNDSWKFNGDFERPTFQPSILVSGTVRLTDAEADRIMAGEKIAPRPTVCHSFVTQGMIQFLPDCTHTLAGQTVPLSPW
jgi:hypothetical protein